MLLICPHSLHVAIYHTPLRLFYCYFSLSSASQVVADVRFWAVESKSSCCSVPTHALPLAAYGIHSIYISMYYLYTSETVPLNEYILPEGDSQTCIEVYFDNAHCCFIALPLLPILHPALSSSPAPFFYCLSFPSPPSPSLTSLRAQGRFMAGDQSGEARRTVRI